LLGAAGAAGEAGEASNPPMATQISTSKLLDAAGVITVQCFDAQTHTLLQVFCQIWDKDYGLGNHAP
jgi:hypothetical protein